MYNSFLLIFHNHLHLIIDLSLICNAHYSYELKMFFISHYSSSTGKDPSYDCCSRCVNQELEPGEQHRCRTRSTSLPWECSRTEIASTEWRSDVCWVHVSKVKGMSRAICSTALSMPAQACLSLCWHAWQIAEKDLTANIFFCIPAFCGRKIQLSLMKGLHSGMLVRYAMFCYLQSDDLSWNNPAHTLESCKWCFSYSIYCDIYRLRSQTIFFSHCNNYDMSTNY